MYYEELHGRSWHRIEIDGEMLTGRAHHVIHFASPGRWLGYPELQMTESPNPLAPNPNLGVPTVHLIPTALPSDVEARIRTMFPEQSAKTIQTLTQLRYEDSELFGDRIVRCIVFCTWHYPKSDLESWIRQARTDYRDLIVAAEYDRNDTQLRDFNRPFTDDTFSPTSRHA